MAWMRSARRGEQSEAETTGCERSGGGFADTRGGTGDHGNAAGVLIEGGRHGMSLIPAFGGRWGASMTAATK
jgi:hypothetical protein